MLDLIFVDSRLNWLTVFFHMANAQTSKQFLYFFVSRI